VANVFIMMYQKQLLTKSYRMNVGPGIRRYFYFRASQCDHDGELSPLIVVGSQLFINSSLP